MITAQNSTEKLLAQGLAPSRLTQSRAAIEDTACAMLCAALVYLVTMATFWGENSDSIFFLLAGKNNIEMLPGFIVDNTNQ